MRLGLAVAIIPCVLLLAFRPVSAADDGARFLSALTWDTMGTSVGGLSAILVSDEGTRGFALADKGVLFEIGIQRDNGALKTVTVTGHHSLVDDIDAKDALFDSEGLAQTNGDTVFVSFEQENKILRYDMRTKRQDFLETPKAFRGMAWNRGLESLAMSADGQIYTLEERPRTQQRGFSIWRWDGTAWSQPFHLPAADGFLAVSAEFGPDGRFYLLERRVTLFGFQTRLRRWDITAQAAINQAVLLTTRAGQFGNLEGLSLWRNGKGQLIATLVSDDNFSRFLPTQLVEYALTE